MDSLESIQRAVPAPEGRVMAGGRVNPDQKRQIFAMRAAGWSLPAISERVGASVSTCKRVLAGSGVKRGEAQEKLAEQARAELDGVFDDDAIRRLYGEILTDTAAHVRLLRQKSAECLECLDPTSGTKAAAMCFRALAAHATVLKLTSDTVRSLATRPLDPDQIPELVIRALTKEDLERLRLEQQDESELMGDRWGEAEELQDQPFDE